MVDIRLMDRVNQGFRTFLQALMFALLIVFFLPTINEWVGNANVGWLAILSLGFLWLFLFTLSALFITWLFASIFFPRPRNY